MNHLIKALVGAVIAYTGIASAQTIQNPGAASGSPSVLMITRGDTAATSLCDVGVYLQNELIARLMAGQSVSLNLAPGEAVVVLKPLGTGHCAAPMASLKSQSLILPPGEIRQYRIVQSEQGFFLAPVDLY